MLIRCNHGSCVQTESYRQLSRMPNTCTMQPHVLCLFTFAMKQHRRKNVKKLRRDRAVRKNPRLMQQTWVLHGLAKMGAVPLELFLQNECVMLCPTKLQIPCRDGGGYFQTGGYGDTNQKPALGCCIATLRNVCWTQSSYSSRAASCLLAEC